MAIFSEIDHDSGALSRILQASIPSRLLLSGIELKVFNHLTDPISAGRLAGKIGSHPENTRLFLDALTANGLLLKKEGLYRNSPSTNRLLVEGGTTYIGGALLDDAEWMLAGLENLNRLVLEGPPPGGRAPHSLSWSEEIRVRANRQRIEDAPRSVDLVRSVPEFDRMRKMLDLGCGAGLIGIAIVAAHPAMTGVLFDRPEVTAVAERFIAESGMDDRVSTLAGDFLADPIGSSYDLVWAGHVIRRHHLATILEKVHDALEPGGVFINVAEGLVEERTGPARMINLMLANNLHGTDSMFDRGEVAAAMREAGFSSVRTLTLEDDTHGSVTADIARK